MVPRGKLVLAGALVLGALAWFAGRIAHRASSEQPRRVTVGSSGVPHSSDPIDQDVRANSQAFLSVYATLVSKSVKGRYLGVAASGWTSNEDHTVWTFRMRDSLRFETGAPVTAEAVVASWGRLARRLVRRGSRTGFFERLDGFAAFDGVGPLPGVAYDAHSLTLRFREPFPGLLDTIGFPLYSVVDPACYGADGEWTCPHRAVSSGPYRVVSWGPDSMTLRLREDFPEELRHKRAPLEVVIRERRDGETADLLLGASLEPLAAEGMRYWGGTSSAISYLTCMSWSRPESVCGSRDARRALRDALYREMLRRGLHPALSFFPPSVPGVKEAPLAAQGTDAGVEALEGRRISFRPSWSYLSPAEDALEAVAVRHSLRFEAARTPLPVYLRELQPGLPAYTSDIAMGSTILAIDDPDFSVRFMFRSKEGIRLPDPTGRIARELDAERVDLPKVDALLWDDAVVWPYLHYSFGAWARPDLDLSAVNLDDVSLALHWVGVGD